MQRTLQEWVLEEAQAGLAWLPTWRGRPWDVPALCCASRQILADFSAHLIVGQVLHYPSRPSWYSERIQSQPSVCHGGSGTDGTQPSDSFSNNQQGKYSPQLEKWFIQSYLRKQKIDIKKKSTERQAKDMGKQQFQIIYRSTKTTNENKMKSSGMTLK